MEDAREDLKAASQSGTSQDSAEQCQRQRKPTNECAHMKSNSETAVHFIRQCSRDVLSSAKPSQQSPGSGDCTKRAAEYRINSVSQGGVSGVEDGNSR